MFGYFLSGWALYSGMVWWGLLGGQVWIGLDGQNGPVTRVDPHIRPPKTVNYKQNVDGMIHM